MSTLFERLDRQQEPPRDSVEADFQKIWQAARFQAPEPDIDIQWSRLESRMGDLEPVRGPRMPRFVFGFAAVAAVLLAAWLITSYTAVTPEVSYITARGDQRTLNLADHSVVKLNAASSLLLHEGFNEAHRNVTLEGEAFFSVEKGKHPFRIQTDLAAVEVLGTEFNVYARDEIIEVGVTEGKVAVTVGTDETIYLTAGQRIKATAEGFVQDEPQAIGFPQFPAWTNGRLYFHEQSLSFVTREIERFFDVDVVLELEDAASRQEVSGLIGGDDPEAAIKNVCNVIQRNYRFENGRYVIF